MKSNIFLFTATLVLVILLVSYESPQTTEVEPVAEPETVVVNDVVVEAPVDKDGWYEQQIFEQTPFEMVRANFNYRVPVIEIIQARESTDVDTDVEKLKAVIEEKLGEVHILLLDASNQEVVKAIYE